MIQSCHTVDNNSYFTRMIFYLYFGVRSFFFVIVVFCFNKKWCSRYSFRYDCEKISVLSWYHTYMCTLHLQFSKTKTRFKHVYIRNRHPRLQISSTIQKFFSIDIFFFFQFCISLFFFWGFFFSYFSSILHHFDNLVRFCSVLFISCIWSEPCQTIQNQIVWTKLW